MMVLWTMLSVAAAAPGLAWSWVPSTAVHYHLEAVINSPRGYTWVAENGENARSIRATVALDIACQATPAGKRWDVACSLDNVVLKGAAVQGEEQRLRTLLDLNEAHLKDKTVQFRMGTEGGIRRFDLRGMDTRNSRLGSVFDGLKSVLRRAFTPLDLWLPKGGQDNGKKWSQKGSPLVFELMTGQGTAGGVALKHVVERRDQGKARIVSDGRASLAMGVDLEAGTSALVRMYANGRTQFDTTVGLLDWSEVITTSAHGTSSLDGLSGIKPSSFSAWAGRVLGDGTRLEPQP
jgi:hypothetical protein